MHPILASDHSLDGPDGCQGGRQLLHRPHREGERQQRQAHCLGPADRHEGSLSLLAGFE